VVAIESQARRIFGLQYHPEVAHTEQGTDTLRHFLLDIAGLTADWSMAEVLETQLKLIEQQVGTAAGASDAAAAKMWCWMVRLLAAWHMVMRGCPVDALSELAIRCMRAHEHVAKRKQHMLGKGSSRVLSCRTGSRQVCAAARKTLFAVLPAASCRLAPLSTPSAR
jgi:hypothetical protein